MTYIESGIRTRLHKTHLNLQEVADNFVAADFGSPEKKAHLDRLVYLEGVTKGLETALEIVEERGES